MDSMESRDFSLDIFFEILTRTSLQTLDKCRLVCKEWRNITYESSFTHLHCERTKSVLGYFIQSMTNNKHSTTFVSMDETNSVSRMSLNFLPNPVKIEASSNQGILFCLSQKPQNPRNPRIPQYYVCKPSTKQWQVMPNPKTQYFTERIAMMVLRSSPLHYKIVRFSLPKFSLRSKEYQNLRCEIFDSKNWAWKHSKDVQLPYSVILSHEPAILASGAIHWLTTHDHVFAFDADQESWQMFPLPKPLYENDHYEYKHLVEYEGQVALICKGRDESMELWVLKDYSNLVWDRRHKLSIEALDQHASPAAFYNADIALMKGYYQMIFFKFQNCTSNYVVKLDKHVDEVFSFRSDLGPTNLMGRI